MISIEEAEEMVKEKVSNENLRKHMYAVSAIMKELAKHFEEDEKKWEVVGLLHDIDYDQTKDNPEKHGLLSAEMLEKHVPTPSLDAIKAHNHEHTGVKPEDRISKSLIAADAVSGLIVTTALVMPNRKMSEVRVKSVLKKFNDSSFAKNIDRDRIMYCEEVGLDKKEFIEISLNALNGISDKLGL